MDARGDDVNATGCTPPPRKPGAGAARAAASPPRMAQRSVSGKRHLWPPSTEPRRLRRGWPRPLRNEAFPSALQRSRGVSAADGCRRRPGPRRSQPFNGAAASPPRMAQDQCSCAVVLIRLQRSRGVSAADGTACIAVLPLGSTLQRSRGVSAADGGTDERLVAYRGDLQRSRGVSAADGRGRRGGWRPLRCTLQRSRGVSAADGQGGTAAGSRRSAFNGAAASPPRMAVHCQGVWGLYVSLQRSRGVSAADGHEHERAPASSRRPSTEPRRLRRGWAGGRAFGRRSAPLQRSRGVSAADGGHGRPGRARHRRHLQRSCGVSAADG